MSTFNYLTLTELILIQRVICLCILAFIAGVVFMYLLAIIGDLFSWVIGIGREG